MMTGPAGSGIRQRERRTGSWIFPARAPAPMVDFYDYYKEWKKSQQAVSYAFSIYAWWRSGPAERERRSGPMTGHPAPGRGRSPSLRWNIILCAGILFLAVAFVAGVLFLTGSPAGSSSSSSTPATAGKTLPALKTKVLPRLGAADSSPPGSQAKKLPGDSAGIRSLKSSPEMHPTEPNMTVIAKTSASLSYNRSSVEVNVTDAPLRVDLTIVPKTVIETKWFENKTLDTRREWIEQVPVVLHSSFATLSVIEKESGLIVARAGFGRNESLDTTREVRVYKPGTYLVQVFGNDVAIRTVLSVRTPGLTF